MTEDEQAIRNVVAKWLTATAAGKANDLRPLMAEDVTFLTPGQPPIAGRDFFVDGLKHTFRQLKIESVADIQEVQVAGDMAYCWNHLTVTVTPKAGGNPVVRTGYTLSVLRKQPGGGWVIARDANMLATVDDD